MSQLSSESQEGRGQHVESREVRLGRAVTFERMPFTPEEQQLAQQEIERIVNNPERKIGEGGIGEVFHTSKGLCVKLMKTTPDRAGGRNHVSVEAELQLRLASLNIEGVRVPRCYGFWAAESGNERHGIIMEQLDAVNLQLALNGTDKFPPNFNPELFADLLEQFVAEVHVQGILHNDMWPRNVMIDRNTGKPYLIDFGNSKELKSLENRGVLSNEELEQLDQRIRRPLEALTKL